MIYYRNNTSRFTLYLVETATSAGLNGVNESGNGVNGGIMQDYALMCGILFSREIA